MPRLSTNRSQNSCGQTNPVSLGPARSRIAASFSLMMSVRNAPPAPPPYLPTESDRLLRKAFKPSQRRARDSRRKRVMAGDHGCPFLSLFSPETGMLSSYLAGWVSSTYSHRIGERKKQKKKKQRFPINDRQLAAACLGCQLRY